MFELWGIATNSAPVRADVSSSQVQRSSGYGLSTELKGWNRAATSAPALVNTTRCRLAPAGIELHSQPISAVNRPGSFWASAARTASCQTDRAIAAAPGMPWRAGCAADSSTEAGFGRNERKAAMPSSRSTTPRSHHSVYQASRRSTSPRSSVGMPCSTTVRITPRYSA